MEKNEMGGACSMLWWGGIGVYKVLVGKPEGRNHLEDPGIDGRIILSWIFGSGMVGVNWIDIVQVRDSWRALVNMVMKLWVPYLQGISCLAENLLASQEGLCCAPRT
jgi:hypothetical protein